MGALDAIFKAYDVRGTVPDQLDAEVCRAIGSAFASFTGAERLVVGRDMRDSGVELSSAFIEGATSRGSDVVDLGLASTDLLYFASGRLDAPGAMFTASHNPAAYNGIKMCLSGARPVGQETGLAEVKAGACLVMSGRTAGNGRNGPGGPAAPGSVEAAEMLHDYGEHVRSFVDPSALSPLRVVADVANGMGGLVVPEVFAGLPFDLELLYPDLDGSFPNHPADPIQAENLVDLQVRVRDTGADVGLAFDGDADRVFLVDDLAAPLSGSLTTAMVASALLERNPGATILYNLICSRAVPEVISEKGGIPRRTRVGHSFIKEVMADTGALFGGEHSGHYYFRDNYRADSGVVAALIVLELLCRSAQPLSVVRQPFERYAGSGEINTQVPDPAAVIDAVADRFTADGEASLDRLDGLTVELGDWWFNLRPSNTEPLLRLNVEADTGASCEAHVAEIVSLIEGLGPRTGAGDRSEH